jgi:cyanate lyase
MEVKTGLKREECTEKIIDAIRKKNLTFKEIAGKIGKHKVWVASALHGQASMSKEEAEKTVTILGLDPECGKLLQECPSKGALSTIVPTDPLIYRLYEIMAIYGVPMKSIIHLAMES